MLSKAEFLALPAKNMRVETHRSRELPALRLTDEHKTYSYAKNGMPPNLVRVAEIAPPSLPTL